MVSKTRELEKGNLKGKPFSYHLAKLILAISAVSCLLILVLIFGGG